MGSRVTAPERAATTKVGTPITVIPLDADRPAQVELKQSFVALWRYRLLADSWQPFRRTGQNAIIKLNGGYAIASSSRS